MPLPAPATHGGARKGAGRKPKGDRAGVSHHGRPELTEPAPVHVTLRILSHVWNPRSQRSLRVIEAALEGPKTWREFRVVHFSIQGEHLHFIVEANDNRALSEGMQGLQVRLAKGLNRLMDRHGKVFADRFHAHVLRTPAEVRNALAYVLLNRRSHMARIGKAPAAGLDPFSSAAAFDGWREIRPEPATVTSPPQTWLLGQGWRKRGLLSPHEIPAAN
jgi:REP element-mobilizing transposase RayT